MNRKKICVVGGGYWGQNHIKTLNSLEVQVGVVENNIDQLKMLKQKFLNIKCYETLKSSLEDGYEGYVVATPSETHFKIAEKIIKAKKPVLVEKPMALKVEDAEKLVALAQKKNVNLMVGHVLLFHPAILKIKSLISDGEIGDLQYIYSNRVNLGKVRLEENVFWSLAPHDIAIFQYLTGSFPKSIQSKGSSFLQKGIADSTLTHLEYENNVKGHIFVSWLHPFKEHRLVVIGSKAMISFEDSTEGRPLKYYSKKFDFINGVPKKKDGPVKLLPYEEKMPLEEELKYFIKHLKSRKIQISNGEEGLDVVKILSRASGQLLQ